MVLPVVSARAFTAMQNLNVALLSECGPDELRPLLPSLVRMSLLSPYNSSRSAVETRKQILSLLVGIEVVNNIVSFLQVDYDELETDVKKEQQLRQKSGNSAQDSAHYHGLQNGVALGFERADVTRKVRIVLSELFYIQSQIFEQNQLQLARGHAASAHESVARQSELFDNEIYLEEITDIVCIALAELPSLFNIQEVIETLLYVNSGSTIICWVVANTPDCFKEVLTALIANGDEDTADGRLRSNALSSLCAMCPGSALPTRTLCMDLQRMPTLMLQLSLRDADDLVAFVTGLLLGNDAQQRAWTAGYVRQQQKRKGGALQAVRDELLKQLHGIVVRTQTAAGVAGVGVGAVAAVPMSDELVVQGATLLRLYCALRGIAGVKFVDDEIALLVELVTTKPPPTAAGIRFVSVGYCMLIACPSLIAQPAHEAKSIEWMQWLIREDAYFERRAGASAFGEMLLLMAIHFHSNQVAAITELVCLTLGMKLQLRQNNTTRMKQIFTQEIFTEQVVAQHAVCVPVTQHLNATIPGYLPVHCIHQLLRSRAFSKHKVPIRSWIYRQICSVRTPLHPVLPALIEAYVQSIVAPQAKGPLELTHKPLSEEEIVRVFQRSVAGGHLVAPTRGGSVVDVKDVSGDGGESPSVTSQLLLLYYLLLYEDMRLSNMATILAAGRKIKSYSTEFLSELPIKYLLQHAQKAQHEYGGLFSPLLRLLVTHFPHLSLVDDWIEEEQICCATTATVAVSNRLRAPTPRPVRIQSHTILEAFEALPRAPAKCVRLLRVLRRQSPTDVWPHAELIIQFIRRVLAPGVPRLVQELYKQVWTRLNTVLPRRLWLLTVNALQPDDGDGVYRTYKASELAQDCSGQTLLDPMQVLRCDERVFRCPDVLAIVLRILQASLAASKTQLARHMLDRPLMQQQIGPIGMMLPQQQPPLQALEAEREELRTALVASQESAAVQILLEACLETAADRRQRRRKRKRTSAGVDGDTADIDTAGDGGAEWAVREVRGVVCSYIHQVFIAEPSLARLVHFQGYPRELLAMTVRGIPSMHICIDFVPELLAQAELDKQVFAIDLTSHLGLQFALPKSIGVAKLCLNALATLLTLLSNDTRVELFRAVLPCVVRFGEAFPPLLDDCMLLLMQLGRLAESQLALGRVISLPSLSLSACSKVRVQTRQQQAVEQLVAEVRETFARLMDEAVLKPRIY